MPLSVIYSELIGEAVVTALKCIFSELIIFVCFFREAAMFPDALDAAGRVEGLPLSSPQTLLELEEEGEEEDEDAMTAQRGSKRQGRYRKSLQLLKPFRITQK